MTLLMRQIQRSIDERRARRYHTSDVRRLPKDEEGQAMTEFCIILPLLLFLIFGILQLMLISNAAYMLNLANYYALRTGVVHFENYQYGLESGDLEDKMRDEAIRVLSPILPRLMRDPLHYFMTTVPIVLNTEPDVSNRIPEGSTDNWLSCQTEMPFHLYVPFAGGIIASIYWWGEWGVSPSNRLISEGIYIREHPIGMFHPLWPYIWMRTLNYDYSNSRSPGNNIEMVDHHRMAIARRIYR